jgi:sugar lactone lactonase YvrE
MAVDSDSQLYVLDPTGSISVFSSTASGAATPMRHIQGPLTQLVADTVPNAISVDATGNIYVSLASTSYKVSNWTILVFTSSATGNIAPARVITVTNPCTLDNSFQVALDVSGNFYVACTETEGTVITEFASNGTTVAAPVKTISGPVTGLGIVLALRVDSAGNIYALSYTQSAGLSVKAFGASGSGNFAPAIQFDAGSMTSGFPQLALK